jgi:hypothetical protein
MDGQGRERVIVYDGAIEVRTPQRTTQVEAGQLAHVDNQGLYGLVDSENNNNNNEFERWFTQRAERYEKPSSQYLEAPLAYSDSDLEENGSWIYASAYGTYAWRPRVSAGWRPYYYGQWGYGPGGCLTWISYEPWGWVPYHYGRWGFDAVYGWLWMPGYNYAPAWVYWAYGPGYVGWAPSGWYDCYRPYYGWAYKPYSRAGSDLGFGFYGRVRMNEVDLRPWTFVSPNGLTSNRVDQAAMTTDAIRQRLARDPAANLATVSGAAPRFSRSEIKDPASAVNNIVRRGVVGGGTGKEGSGTASDLTSFFRRDPELSGAVKDRIVRSRVPEISPSIAGSVPAGPSGVGVASGIPSPGTRGTLEGKSDKDGTNSRGDYRPGDGVGRVFQDPYGTSTPQSGTTPRNNTNNSGSSRRNDTVWRDRNEPANPPATAATPATPDSNWRGRTVGGRATTPASGEATRGTNRGSDVPRRIIDRIGGARITPGDPARDTTTTQGPTRNDPPRTTYAPPRNDPPKQAAPQPQPKAPETRSAPAPQPQPREAPKQERAAPPPAKSHDDGGGHVKREH